MDRSLCSFFRFVALDQEQRAALVSELQQLLMTRRVRGSVYVAAEGVNGQLSVPIAELDALRDEIAHIDALLGMELNVQHHAFGLVRAGEGVPYRKLVVREKTQILTDGLQSVLAEEEGRARRHPKRARRPST